MSYTSVIALLDKGVSRPTLYKVQIPFGGAKKRLANDQLEFLCKTTRVPQVATMTMAANGHDAMGVVREQPTRIEFSKPFSITVISDRDYTVYKEVRKWFETLCSNGGANPEASGGISTGSTQRMSYYNDITDDYSN